MVAGLSSFLLLALVVQASAGVTEENVATLLGYVAAHIGMLQGTSDMPAVLSYFAPKMSICTFPTGPTPLFAADIEASECMLYIGAAAHMGVKYWNFNIKVDNVVVNGTTGYVLYIWDIAALGPEGLIPGTTVKDVKNIVMFTLDDQHKIIGYEDWWTPGTMARVDALVQARSKAAMGTSLPSYELTSLWNKTRRIEPKSSASSSDSDSENVAALLGYSASNAGIFDGTSDIPTTLSYFAPMLKLCTFPEGPNPAFAKDVTSPDCFLKIIGDASQDGKKYFTFNIRIANVAVNGSIAYVLYVWDIAALGPDGLIPGTTVKDVKDIVLFALDDQHKITSYEDWWTPGTMARVDALVQARSKAAAGTILTSQELLWNKSSRIERQTTSLVACLLLCTLAFILFKLVKKQDQDNDSQGYQALLQA